MVNALEQYDPQIYELMRQERARQSGAIRLIPSENYVSRAVMLASGGCLTNKYAEGYPGRRYYEGQQVTDLIEKTAQERAKKLFKADHANVQPYSGSVANMAAYASLSQSVRLFGNQLTEAQIRTIVDVVTAKGAPKIREAAAQPLGALSLSAEQIKDLILSF